MHAIDWLEKLNLSTPKTTMTVQHNCCIQKINLVFKALWWLVTMGADQGLGLNSGY